MSLTRLRKQGLCTKGWGEGRCQTCNSKCSGRHFAAAYMQSFGDHNYGGKAMPGFLGVVSQTEKLDIERLKNMEIECSMDRIIYWGVHNEAATQVVFRHGKRSSAKPGDL